MPQIGRESRPTTGRPARVAPRVRALVGPIAVPAVKVEQQVHFARHRVIEIRRRALDRGLDDGRGAAGSRPGAEEARGGGLDEDGLLGLVLHEAEEVGAVGVEGEDCQVYYVGGGLVDVGLWGGECLEVGGVGIADLGVGGRACVFCVRGGIEFGGPEDHVLRFGEIVSLSRPGTWLRVVCSVPFAGSQIASGAHTMPAVESSTVTSLSLTQFTRSLLSQTNIPLEPVRCAASQEVCDRDELSPAP